VLERIPSWILVASGAALLWLSQPPLKLSFLAWFALVPWLLFAAKPSRKSNRLVFLLIAIVYWTITMQGIRHAHPAMYAALLAFAFYLACYSLAFVSLVGNCYRWNAGRRMFWIAVPVVGTGLECIRNYLLTGISAVMIGHTQADNPQVIQIADAFGSYGVTFLVLLVNGAIFQTIFLNQEIAHGPRLAWRRFFPAIASALLLVICLAYGSWRLQQSDKLVGEPIGLNVALIGRDEEIVFDQNADRELEIFNAYFVETMKAAEQTRQTGQNLDAIVWPESMFTGSLPWFLPVGDSRSDASPGKTSHDPSLVPVLEEKRGQFEYRAAQVQAAVRRVTGQTEDPHLLVGCSVVDYQDPPCVFSSVVHVGQRGQVQDWYGKTHLVMFGEYIPLIDYLPFVERFVPPGMGVQRGSGPKAMSMGTATVSPNVCIETAVERVVPRQVAELERQGHSPDFVVNVTNDGWFDRSSIVDHHLRCSQLVAVACRRPVLISANGGPTAWIDGSGRVVQKLRYDEQGALIANVATDGRRGLYQTIGDWPARALAIFVVCLCGLILYRRFVVRM
jgi:apolipoprotein N-acyltransferase